MKPGPRQFSLGSLMIAIEVFAVAFANRELTAKLFTAKFLIGAFAPLRLIPVLVVFIIVVLVVFNYLVLSPCLWLIAVVEHRLGASRDDGREP